MRWDRGIPGAAARAHAAGDTAMVELAFDATAGQTLHLHPARRHRASAAEAGQPLAVATRRVDQAAGPAGTTASRPTTLARGPGAGRPTSSSTAIPRCSASSARCCSTCSAARTRAPAHRHPADGALQRRATTGTSSGTPTPGCSRPWPAHPSRRRPLDGRRSGPARCRPHEANARANGYRGAHVSLGGRRARRRDHAALRRAERQLRDPRERRRRPRAMAVLPRHRRLDLARARGVSGASAAPRTSG